MNLTLLTEPACGKQGGFFISIFENMSAVKILPHYTYADYVQWEGRWELIDGIPFAMSPAPTPRHQLVANTIGALFYMSLKNCKHCKAYQFVDYKISEDTIVQPDLVVLRHPAIRKFIDFPPSLVVEILSPATALKDRHTKSSFYQRQGIPYYIIVSPDNEEAEVYLLENDEYVLCQKGADFTYSFRFEGNCEATIDFAEIWK